MRTTTIVFLMTLLVTAIGSAQQAPEQVNQKLLTIDGEPVFAADLSFVLQGMRAQSRGSADTEEMVQAALKRVVETKLMAREARRRGLSADEKRVQSMVQSIVDGSGGRAALEANLKKAGTDMSRLEASVTETELARLLIAGLRSEIEVNDAEIKKFYDDTPELFVEPDKVRARHILLPLGEDAGWLEEQAARDAAEKARARALAGEDFAELAKELSGCPSAPRGGDLGFFSAEQMEKAFAEAAFSLEPGHVSQVVRTRYGYHVIKTEEQRPGGAKQELAEVRERIADAITQYKTDQALIALLDSLREKSEIVPAGVDSLPAGLDKQQAGG